MVEIGFKLASELFEPKELINYAKHAEEAGFDFAVFLTIITHGPADRVTVPLYGVCLEAYRR